jgi:hypothetical protein
LGRDRGDPSARPQVEATSAQPPLVPAARARQRAGLAMRPTRREILGVVVLVDLVTMLVDLCNC